LDEQWKFAGLCPDIRWGEYDFDKVFEDGREELGDKEKAEEAAKLAAQAGGIPAEK
jgi:scytalone dehydratase